MTSLCANPSGCPGGVTVLGTGKTELEVEKSEGSLEELPASKWVGHPQRQLIIQRGKARTDVHPLQWEVSPQKWKGLSRRGFAGQIGAQQVVMEQKESQQKGWCEPSYLTHFEPPKAE